MVNKSRIIKAYNKRGYLSKWCETIFEKYNYKEELLFKDFPERMVYEARIWIIGSAIWDSLQAEKGSKTDYSILLEEILQVINTEKYYSGRESFVMILHYFKNNSTVESQLETLLDDKQLYGFAIYALNKLKLYHYQEKINDILIKEKTTWIRKEAERYLKIAITNKCK